VTKKPKAITHVERPEKWAQKVPIKKGALGQYGYLADISEMQRHKALRQAIRTDGYETVVKRLTFISNVNNKKPVGQIFRSDLDWVERQNSKSHWPKTPNEELLPQNILDHISKKWHAKGVKIVTPRSR
jgi:hypothetical protein